MEAVKELIFKLADDLLILGHRNSEWTGIGPVLEEDIAFASMAQDKVGQSRALYQLLTDMGAPDPDTLAFGRNAPQFHNCTLNELPIGDYAFSTVRHYLYDTSLLLRLAALKNSSYQPLAQLAAKFYGEVKYHVMHANTWVKQLGTGHEGAVMRMQNALTYAFPYALAIFELSPYEEELIQQGIFSGEAELHAHWLDSIKNTLAQTQLTLPCHTEPEPQYGGRIGNHTPHLQHLLDEMSEVFNIDPTATW